MASNNGVITAHGLTVHRNTAKIATKPYEKGLKRTREKTMFTRNFAHTATAIAKGQYHTLAIVAIPGPTGTPTATPPATPTPTPIPSGKVTMCHKGKHSISASANAVPAHLAHGDTLGFCP